MSEALDNFTYTAEELRQIQKIELEILKVTIQICNKLGIEYFVDSGTVLGAVRHQGFIPWDDDIDIGMTRDNYMRFVKEAPKCLPEGYYLQTPYDSPVPHYFCKVRKNGTEFVEYCNRKVKMHHGIYIDIFPYDEIPDNNRCYKKQLRYVCILNKLFCLRQSKDVFMIPENNKEKLKALVRKPIHALIQLVPYRFLLRKLENSMTQYNGNGEKQIANLSFALWKEFHIDKKDMYPLKKCLFEDIEVFLPNNTDIYLTKMYGGGYMEFPPEEERYGHKPYRFALSIEE